MKNFVVAAILLAAVGATLVPGQSRDQHQPVVVTEAAARNQEVQSPISSADSALLAKSAEQISSAVDSIEAEGTKLTIVIVGIVVVGIILTGVLVVQILVLNRSVATARNDVVTRNRPSLVVRHVDLEVFEAGKLAKVHWVAENMGNSAATITEAHASLLVVRRGGLPAIPAYDERNHAVGGLHVEPNRAIAFVQFSPENVSSSEYDALFRTGQGAIFFYGHMLYSDEIGTRRRVGFCRKYDIPSGRFTVLDDLNYEYRD